MLSFKAKKNEKKTKDFFVPAANDKEGAKIGA